MFRYCNHSVKNACIARTLDTRTPINTHQSRVPSREFSTILPLRPQIEGWSASCLCRVLYCIRQHSKSTHKLRSGKPSQHLLIYNSSFILSHLLFCVYSTVVFSSADRVYQKPNVCCDVMCCAMPCRAHMRVCRCFEAGQTFLPHRQIKCERANNGNVTLTSEHHHTYNIISEWDGWLATNCKPHNLHQHYGHLCRLTLTHNLVWICCFSFSHFTLAVNGVNTRVCIVSIHI